MANTREIQQQQQQSVAVEHLDSGFLSLMDPPPDGKRLRTHLILLNWNLPFPASTKLWERATYKICADGGANRLYDLMHSNLGSSSEGMAATESHLPSAIIGDLDSLRADVQNFYLERGVMLKDLSADQDSTDLQKCLKYLEERIPGGGGAGEDKDNVTTAADYANTCGPLEGEMHGKGEPEESQQDLIIVLGALGGRLDHTLSNLNALYANRHLNIVLWGEGNLVRLVRGPGETRIHPDRSCMRWNLHDTKMEVGGLISACNLIDEDEIWVKTDRDLLWMTTISSQFG